MKLQDIPGSTPVGGTVRSRRWAGCRCRRQRSPAVVVVTTSLLLLLLEAALARSARAEGEPKDEAPSEASEAGTTGGIPPTPDSPPPARPEPPVVFIAPPPPEPDPPDNPPPPAPPSVRERSARDRFEASLGVTMFPAALGNVGFSGSGSLPGLGRTAFHRSGRELGLRNPTFWGGELALGYRHTYFSVMVSGVYAGNSRPDATPTDTQAAAQAGASSVKAYGGAIELYGAAPLGRLTVSIGAVAGLRAYSLPLVGFEPTTCTSSSRRGRRSYPCPETATTNATPYVQPRLRVDVVLDKTQTVFLGAYVGVDALGDRSMLGGLMFGLRLPSTGS
jgi:hypothetical protein